MNDTRTDAELVAQWRQSVESCRAHYVGDWAETSLHIPAGELLRLCELVRELLALKQGSGVMSYSGKKAHVIYPISDKEGYNE